MKKIIVGIEKALAQANNYAGDFSYAADQYEEQRRQAEEIADRWNDISAKLEIALNVLASDDGVPGTAGE